jgi:hypothetical protein
LISFFVSKRSKIFLDQSSWMSSPQLGSARHYLLSVFLLSRFPRSPTPLFFFPLFFELIRLQYLFFPIWY